ncbi:MAG: DUF441 family protein [Thermoleophilia bacterium]
MSQATIALILIFAASLIFKDKILAAAAGGLFLLTFFVDKSTLASAGKPAFSIGIFFLMVFILMPVAAEKIVITDLVAQLGKPQFFVAIATAAVISYFGGRGVGFMQQPHILFAVVIGTLIGVLFLRGLPAGLVIASGIVSVAAGFLGNN